MVRRLRVLLEAPHDPAVAQAVVALASVVTVCLLVLIGLGAGSGTSDGSRTASGAATRAETMIATEPQHRSTAQPIESSQDPQDHPGTAAARRAHRELASHRALQHVPYRRGGAAISLRGARGARAVLVVEAPSIRAARRAWRRFLDRFGDDGRSYLPVFRATGGARG